MSRFVRLGTRVYAVPARHLPARTTRIAYLDRVRSHVLHRVQLRRAAVCGRTRIQPSLHVARITGLCCARYVRTVPTRKSCQSLFAQIPVGVIQIGLLLYMYVAVGATTVAFNIAREVPITAALQYVYTYDMYKDQPLLSYSQLSGG